MARMPKISRGIYCCPNFFFPFARPASLYGEECVCVCVCVPACLYIHTSDCVENVYEFALLPNNTAVKHLYTNGERCEVLTGYLSLGRRPEGDWANT
jgi:hypothetical protein